MANVKLSDIMDAMDFQSDETHSFLDRQTGQVLTLSEEELDAAEGDDEFSDRPQWQLDDIELAKIVHADDGSRFLPIPDKFEINEWEIMKDFADSVEDQKLAASLHNAIHGKGAFRFFKSVLHETGRIEEWYAFRTDHLRQFAIDWCQRHGITPDMGEADGADRKKR